MGMSTRYTLARDEIYELDTTKAPGAIEGPSWTSAVGYTVAYDLRNVKNNPTKGVYFELSQDLAGLGGDAHYFRTVGEARGYIPVTDKITLVGRAIGGHITGWGGFDVRASDLFFRGGETIRGFANSGYGPRDAAGTALGGQMFWATTAEVRFPFPLLPEDLGLGGAVFADAGSLWETNSSNATKAIGVVDNTTIRSSVGASLLWNSPLGPLRADYAYVLSKDAVDQTQSFRFGAQTKF